MMNIKELADLKEAGSHEEVHPLNDPKFMVNRLATIKRDAYLHIYNDYLEAVEMK